MAWEDSWSKLIPVQQENEQLHLVVDELLLQRTKAYKTRQVALEFDYRYFPEAVQDQGGERPYYPYAGLWVE